MEIESGTDNEDVSCELERVSVCLGNDVSLATEELNVSGYPCHLKYLK